MGAVVVLIDLSIVIFISLYGYLGWRKGIALAALSIIGLVAAYTAAYFFYEPVGKGLGDALELQPLIALPLGGSAVFFGVLLLAGVGRLILKRQRRRRLVGSPPRYWDNAGGMLLGAGYGAAMASLFVWALSLLEIALPAASFGVKDSRAGRLVAPLSQRLTYWVIKETSGNEAVATTVAQLSQAPPRKIQSAVQIVQDRRVQRLFEDPALVRSLAKNDVKKLKRNRALRALFRDPEFLKKVKQSGLLPEASAEMSPEELKGLLTKKMVPLARVVVGMARDPEFQRLLRDKDLMRKLEQRDLLALLNDPRFNRLAIKTAALLKSEQLEGAGPSSGVPVRGRIRVKKPRRPLPPDARSDDSMTVKSPIYKWKDKQGVVHYSDTRPLPGVEYELVNLEHRLDHRLEHRK